MENYLIGVTFFFFGDECISEKDYSEDIAVWNTFK